MTKMKNLYLVTTLGLLTAGTPLIGQSASGPAGLRTSKALDLQVAAYDLENETTIVALSKLSEAPGVKIHLGIEEALRQRLADSRDLSVRYSMHLERSTVRSILSAICASDRRYVWSVDGETINVYPAARASDPNDLLNFHIAELKLTDIPDPDQGLVPLSHLFPAEQVGYVALGPSNSYREPWTATFRDLSVRQFINRLGEHMGIGSTWVWQGGADARLFTFVKGGFHLP